MGASGGTSANENQSANNSANQAQNNLNGYAGAGTNQNVQSVLGQYGSGGLSLQQAISQLGNSAQSPGATNGSGQTSNGTQDTSGGTNEGAIDQLFTGPATAGLAAQSQVSSNPLYSGMFGPNGQQGQAQQNYTNSTNNLASDRQALSGNDPSYGLQASDLSAYGQESNALGRQAAQTNQGIAQSLAARGLGSSNNGAAIGSYAGAYGNQSEALAGLQNNIAQQRIQTAQGLAQARNSSDLQQQGNAQNYSTALGGLANSAYQGQLASNMQGAENNYNQLAGGAASAQQYQTNQQNINDSQFQQAQATKTSAGGPLGGIISSLGGSAAGAAGASLGGGLGKALGGTTPSAKTN